MRASNLRINTELPSGLVAVFFSLGTTSGIGATTLKQFAKCAKKPRIYFVGRREIEGERVKAELQKLNSDGEYHYLKCESVMSAILRMSTSCVGISKVKKRLLIYCSLPIIGTLISGRRK